MKILFFIESLRSGGKERRLVELIKELAKNPHVEMELVLTKKDIHYLSVFDTGIKIHYTIRKILKKDPRIFFQFYHIAKKSKPDIIHVWGNMVAIYAIFAKVLLRLPMINNQITGAPIKPIKGILSYKLTFPFSDKIVSNTYAGLRSYNAPEIKSLVIYNGFNFKRLNNLKEVYIIKEKFGLNTKYNVGMIATFSEYKDFKSFIFAANLVLETRKDVSFLCVGDGEYDQYKKYVEKNNTNHIIFLEKQIDIENLMNICDVGVLMTNIHKAGEGISNALLEFSALGRPIIAVNNGGNPELIRNGHNGFLIEPFDYKTLSEKINLLLSDKLLRENMGYNAKTIVHEKFSIEEMYNNFLNLYNEVYKNRNLLSQ